MTLRGILDINPLLAERTRLAILSALVAEGGPLDFNSLMERLKLTRGNLSVHAMKLEGAGLVSIEKKFRGKIPLTLYRSTDKGRDELVAFLEKMKSLLGAALAGDVE